MVLVWFTVLLVTILLVLLVNYVRWRQSYWRRLGVAYVPPTFLLGNFGDMMLRKRALPYIIQGLYSDLKARGVRCGGVYQLMSPMLMITDPELLREITVKYFDHFTDRRPLATERADELFARSLLVLNGEPWRSMRHTLSPAFTGSKLRAMTELMNHTARQLAIFLRHRPNKAAPLNIRELFRRFAADVIASTAYGSVVDSVHEPSHEFYVRASRVLDMSGTRGAVLAGYILSPRLMELLRIPLIPSSLRHYFSKLIADNIDYRHKHDLVRPDMIQLLLEARESKAERDTEISDLDIVAQAVTFFLAGFESVTTTLSFAALQLAAHPELQARLTAEVDEAFREGEGKLSYDAIQGLKYMDMVVSEVTRMFPAIPMSDRVCTRHFQLAELTLEPGDVISLPLYALHHDPEFFPQPDKFDPERFSEENRGDIHPFTFMPFGAGPRNCIGMRMALLEVKLCLAHVLATCHLEVCARTHLPIQLSASSPLLGVHGDFWLTLTPRPDTTILLD